SLPHRCRRRFHGSSPMSGISYAGFCWKRKLANVQESATDWLWQWYLAKGNITLFTASSKIGKTTLLSLLLARRRAGGTLAGLPVRAGKTVIVTEEADALWAERVRRLDFGGNVCFYPRPWAHIPSPEEWQTLVERMADLHRA